MWLSISQTLCREAMSRWSFKLHLWSKWKVLWGVYPWLSLSDDQWKHTGGFVAITKWHMFPKDIYQQLQWCCRRGGYYYLWVSFNMRCRSWRVGYLLQTDNGRSNDASITTSSHRIVYTGIYIVYPIWVVWQDDQFLEHYWLGTFNFGRLILCFSLSNDILVLLFKVS